MIMLNTKKQYANAEAKRAKNVFIQLLRESVAAQALW